MSRVLVLMRSMLPGMVVIVDMGWSGMVMPMLMFVHVAVAVFVLMLVTVSRFTMGVIVVMLMLMTMLMLMLVFMIAFHIFSLMLDAWMGWISGWFFYVITPRCNATAVWRRKA
jgi:hypothetical protein